MSAEALENVFPNRKFEYQKLNNSDDATNNVFKQILDAQSKLTFLDRDWDISNISNFRSIQYRALVCCCCDDLISINEYFNFHWFYSILMSRRIFITTINFTDLFLFLAFTIKIPVTSLRVNRNHM